MAKKIFVIAGEASGDLHGANLIRSLRAESKEPLTIHGVGGDLIKDTGALDFFDLAHFHVTGITDALKQLPNYKRAERHILAALKRSVPDLVVLIDNPGFNLHLAAKIKKMGIPIVYYIAPQVWAWAPKRIEKIRRTVTKVLVVFEFEKTLYEKHGIPVAFVGHPLKDLISAVGDVEAARKKLLLGKSRRVVALLPGSRKGEIKMLFSIMMKAAARILEQNPDTAFAVFKAPTLPRAVYERMIREAGSQVPVSLVEEDAYAALKACDAAIVCSGTATLECALLGTPMIITNKGTLLTYAAARAFILVPYIGLPNLVLNAPRIPELIQFDATPGKIADAVGRLLNNTEVSRAMRHDLEEVSRRLGEPGANRRAALEILKVLA